MTTPHAHHDAATMELRSPWLLLLVAVALPVLRALGAEHADNAVMAWLLRFGPRVIDAAFLVLAVRLFAATAVGQRVVLGLFDVPAHVATPAPRRAWLRWMLGALAVTVTGLTIVARHTHRYFTQDDNLTQFLPVIVHGCRSLFAGHFPTWNPHQLLGAPTASVGTYALTYPGTWASYAVAQGVLGDAYATCDVFCSLHLAFGAAATVWCLAQFHVRPALAAMGAVSFALCGYMLVTGRSWFYMTPIALWAPLLLGLVERLRRCGGSMRWALVTGFVIGAFFHAGNAQVWLYAMMTVALVATLQVTTGALSKGHLAWLIGALGFGLALASPLLVAQLDLTRDVARIGGQGAGAARGIAHMVLPWPWPNLARSVEWGGSHDDHVYQSTVFFAGPVAMGIGLTLLCVAMVFRWHRAFVARHSWVLVALVLFVLSLGHEGGLWTLLSRFPPFDRLIGPTKFLPFVTLVFVINASVSLERWLPSRHRVAPVLAVLTAALMLYHCSVARASYYSFADRPYPPLAPVVRAAVVRRDARRVVAITPLRGVGAGHLTALSHNLATVHGALAFHGYDPLVSGTPPNRRLYGRVIDDPLATLLLGVPRVSLPRSDDALAALRAWGVGWILVHRRAFAPSFGENPLMHGLEALDLHGRAQRDHLIAASTEVSSAGDVTLRALEGSAPIAFADAAPSQPLPLRFDARGVTVDLDNVHEGGVTVAVLWRRHMVARVDGRRVDASPDGWGRVYVHTARGRQLRLSYEPPWRAGIVLGVVLGVASALALTALRRRTHARAV